MAAVPPDSPAPAAAAGPSDAALHAAAVEIEQFVGQAGWDQRPALFALVRAAQFTADDPEAAVRLGLDAATGEALTPVEQEALPEGDLDAVLAQIAWPDAVAGCACVQEIVILPPSAEQSLTDDSLLAAAGHPERREARLVVAVLRDGSRAALLRLRSTDGGADELLTGPDLAPNLAAALLTTLQDD